MTLAATFTFPLVVIDFEASALTLESFPIEVGVAIISEPGAQIETWSSLIKPDPAWDIDTQWDPDAERVHGISRWSLRDGAEPRAVIAELNARVPVGCTVWCDGGHYDAHWLEVLVAAGSAAPQFTLADISTGWGNDPALRARYYASSASQPRPHRADADADAAIVCLSLAEALQLSPYRKDPHHDE